jgi:hypothetical protein
MQVQASSIISLSYQDLVHARHTDAKSDQHIQGQFHLISENLESEFASNGNRILLQ